MNESPSPCFPGAAALFRLLFVLAFTLSLSLLSGCECGITGNQTPDDDDIADDDDSNPPVLGDEDCGNSLDDDGDGLADCFDSDCAEDSACLHECTPAATISCGEILSGNNGSSGNSDAIDSYGCTTWDESGPEYTFEFTAATTEEVTAVLTVAGHGNLDVFVLDGDEDCDGTACLAYGASTVHWTANAGQDYLIVVDGYAGAQDNFSLELLCPSGGSGENCFNGVDDDGDGLSDCNDPDCSSDPNCVDENCSNNIDDDGDGYVDCDDTECWNESVCDGENCSNGVDDNSNGLVDCADPDCFIFPACSTEQCYDGIDNDGDSLVDCDDIADCGSSSDCTPEWSCSNGFDDDGDGLTDCDDDECFGDSNCMGEQCLNNQDDDWDGLIDCDDPDCFGNPNCIPEICSNGIDDDGDGDIDCDDVECAGIGTCEPLCTAVDALVCGGTVAGDTGTHPGAADVLGTYACTAANESGNEVAYSFTATMSGEATFVLDGLTADLDLFGLQDVGSGCDPAGCLDFSTSGGTNSESVTLTINSGQTYYIIVEGWNDNVGPYTLNSTCQASGTPEDCSNGLDDDGDSLIDCADFDCAGTVGCQLENCADGLDNDGDGRVDCADPDCTGPPAPSPDCTAEICDDGIDNDGDGFTDCADTECSFLPGCGSENCTDGIDNDSDGRVDCSDPDCLGDPVCNPGAGDDDDDDDLFSGEDCGNNLDDNGNGAVDCDDFLCLFDILCWFLNENCEDGNDNDLDGFVDCADPECYNPVSPGDLPSPANAHPACVPEQCNNTVDDDSDGLTDCADDECASAPACLGEDCSNGIDDDFDGLVDCNDFECSTDPSCTPENCSDTHPVSDAPIDNDGDGLANCDDPECAGNPVCASSGEVCDNDVDDNGNGLIDCAEPSCNTHPICVPEICWNGTDDDGDGDADCADSECAESVDCGDELCWNNIDDDGDGYIDCDDDECIGWASCNSEICDNNVDDDSDGLIDCDDDGCVYFGDCIGETCDNDIDDDLDGLIDCADPDCLAECSGTGEICTNGVDDDGDGDVDCADANCIGLPGCAEDCSNGLDDDGDGAVDCADSDCNGAPGCLAEDCGNDIDDDGDGSIDCGDSDCSSNSVCIAEVCGNGTDDDGDGLVDCDDEECAGVSASCGEVCDNGVDDDGDGLIDLDDPDCAGTPDPGTGTCNPQAELSCGDLESGYTFAAGNTTSISSYSCNNWDESGPEFAYVFRPEVTEIIELCLTNMAEDLDLFILEDQAGSCDSSNCIRGAGNCSTLAAEAGATYYVVVDGYQGAVSTYDIEVDCPSTSEVCDNGIDDDADGLIDCQDEGCVDTVECLELCVESWSLFCGSVASGNTATYSGATDQVDSYSCVPWVESGPEYAYYFQAPLDQANNVNISLSYGSGADLDVFVLADEGIPCNSQECISHGAVFTEFETTPGADYWVAVDGYQGSSGSYSISVNCSPVGGSEDCTNGFDDDADGDIDCDDEECQGSELCGAVCQVAETINCGDQVLGTTSSTECGDGLDDDGDGLVDCADPDCASFQGCGGTDAVGLENPTLYPFHPQTTDVMNYYPCNVGSYDGPEVVYEWTNTGGNRRVEWKLPFPLVHLLPSQGVNLDPIVLDGDNGTCINTQCIESGANNLQFDAVSGHTYYLVIDGDENYKGPYGAELDCDLSD